MSALRRVDMQLLTVVLLLCVIGALAIYSCTRTADSSSRLTMQLAYIIVGLAIMVGTMSIDTGKIRGLAWPIFLSVMALLAIVLLMGTVRETRRWIPIGPVNVQPAELARIAVILMLGAVVARMDDEEYDFIYLVKTLAYVAAPSMLILLQPDLGTPDRVVLHLAGHDVHPWGQPHPPWGFRARGADAFRRGVGIRTHQTPSEGAPDGLPQSRRRVAGRLVPPEAVTDCGRFRALMGSGAFSWRPEPGGLHSLTRRPTSSSR
jgi:hypothetical protein